MKRKGFTLSEVLIALAILGIIATFTIPKVLSSQQNKQYKAGAKEAIAMLHGAYLAYSEEHGIRNTTYETDLTPYFNYVKMDTAGQKIDHGPGQTSLDCTATAPCFRMHNGGTLYVPYGIYFGSGSDTNYMYFMFDPDSQYSGSTNGAGKSLWISLFFTGRITDGSATSTPGFETCGAMCHTSWGTAKPDWFDWD